MNGVNKRTLGIVLVLAAVIGMSITGCQKAGAKDPDIKEEVKETEVKEATEETEVKEVAEETEAVPETAGGYKYMEVFPDSFTPPCNYQEAEKRFYSAKPDDYEDEALRDLAEEYAKKVFYLTDAKLIKDTIGEGYGFGDYGFVVGFRAEDSKDGNDSCCVEVLKATREEYDLFIDDYFEDEETYEEKTDGNVITIDYSCNKLTYDTESEILIYYADLTGERVG